MNENPYQSPQSSDANPLPRAKPNEASVLLEMARAQRGLMWTALAVMGSNFLTNIGPLDLSQSVFLAVAGAWLALVLVFGYFAFRLANASYGILPGIVFALITMAPCVGLLAVLIINGQTQDRLRKAGVKVGFMGATQLQIDELVAAAEGS